jgi:hypothetical protein
MIALCWWLCAVHLVLDVFAMHYASFDIGYGEGLTFFDEQLPEDSVHDFVLRNIDPSDADEAYRSIMDSICVPWKESLNGPDFAGFKSCSVGGQPNEILATVNLSELRAGLVVNVRRGYNTDFYGSMLCLSQLDCQTYPELTGYVSHKIINELAASPRGGYNYNVRIGMQGYQEVVDYVLREKGRRPFTVIDIGGSFVGWTRDIADAIADINVPPSGTASKDIRFFQVDITHPVGWRRIRAHVEAFGKFDFSICSHTLEDVINPAFVAEQLSAISHGGYVATPSKYAELSRQVESPPALTPYRGYIHHRYIFTMHAGTMVGFPKINYIEYAPGFDEVGSYSAQREELSLFWRDKLDLRIVSNNFLGPDPPAVTDMYTSLIQRDDCDELASKLALREYDVDAMGIITMRDSYIRYPPLVQ